MYINSFPFTQKKMDKYLLQIGSEDYLEVYHLNSIGKLVRDPQLCKIRMRQQYRADSPFFKKYRFIGILRNQVLRLR